MPRGEAWVSASVSALQHLLYNQTEDSSCGAVDIRLNGHLFKIRRLHATTKLCREQVLELQYVDDTGGSSDCPCCGGEHVQRG